MAEFVITKDNFEQEVINSDKPVLLDFWAAWCGPCKMLSPIVAKIAEKYDGTVKVGKINVDDEPELANAFKVASIPMVVVMKEGKVVNTSIGYRPIEQIEALLK
ncbi:MAG: thioredoxin [Lachnospiraceae bacterium]|nr:thioredoxin [Lachnospiraceae bacterium]